MHKDRGRGKAVGKGGEEKKIEDDAKMKDEVDEEGEE